MGSTRMDHSARLVSFHATLPQASEVNGNRWNVCAGSHLVLTPAHLSLKFGIYMCLILLRMLWTSVIALLFMKCSILALQFLRCVSRSFLAVTLSHRLAPLAPPPRGDGGDSLKSQQGPSSFPFLPAAGQSPGGAGGGGIFFPRALGEGVGAVRPGGSAAPWQILAWWLPDDATTPAAWTEGRQAVVAWVAARQRGLLGNTGLQAQISALRARSGFERATPGHASGGLCRRQDLPLLCYGWGSDFGPGRSRSNDHLAEPRWNLRGATCSGTEAPWPGTHRTYATVVLDQSHSVVQPEQSCPCLLPQVRDGC
jgi:hypothetical protein